MWRRVHQFWTEGQVYLSEDGLYVQVVDALVGDVEGRACHVLGELLQVGVRVGGGWEEMGERNDRREVQAVVR